MLTKLRYFSVKVQQMDSKSYIDMFILFHVLPIFQKAAVPQLVHSQGRTIRCKEIL